MGISLLNNDLRESLENALAIQTMLQKELEHVDGNKSHLDKLVPDYLKGIYSKTRKDALGFKQRVLTDAYKSGVILLTAAFERIAFAKYRTAAGDTIAYLEKAKDLSTEYYIVRDRFVNPSLKWLSDLLVLLENRITAAQFDRLAEIKEQRNSYAHGNLDTLTTITDYSLVDIAGTLDKMLTEIEQRTSYKKA